MGRKRAQQRRSGLFRRIAEHVRATLGDALWADFVAHANACYKDAFRKPILRCVDPPHGAAPLSRRRDMRESVHDARSASCTWTTSRTVVVTC